jgi:hypothetical protein
MTPIQELYELLAMMIKGAKENKKGKVLELYNDFELMFRKVFRSNGTVSDLGHIYDHCAQSCLASVNMFEEMHEAYLKDAQNKFSQIPKP